MWEIFGSDGRYFWHIWEVCGGVNAIQSSTLADWDLRKDSNGSSGKEHSKPLANTDGFLAVFEHFAAGKQPRPVCL